MAESKDVARDAQSPDLEQLGDDTKGFDLAPGEAEHLAGLRTVELGLSASDVVTTIDKAEEARILRKIDWRLVSLLTFLYL